MAEEVSTYLAPDQMEMEGIAAKPEAAEKWCKKASDHTVNHGGKPWVYVLISQDVIAENMTIPSWLGILL